MYTYELIFNISVVFQLKARLHDSNTTMTSLMRKKLLKNRLNRVHKNSLNRDDGAASIDDISVVGVATP